MNVRKMTLLLAIFAFSINVAHAQSLAEIKQRMKKRVIKIAELKKDQVIGEKSSGFLAVANPPENQEKLNKVRQLVKAENEDRKKVYTAIAEHVGTSVEEVGKHRALTIYENSAAGVLLKGNDGKWYEKE